MVLAVLVGRKGCESIPIFGTRTRKSPVLKTGLFSYKDPHLLNDCPSKRRPDKEFFSRSSSLRQQA
jgi:hypothetical protein